ncbi:hypothetical protein TNCT_517751 [Trichonephila clavata]|uniref:Uncharacterized protein n=1 Tax=Trichonephila clavata TaxID=2740835 RepID=A0A8X6GA79_TRICU|nr:hypothetical protein TNCT_517751 [Trichonephila clavata]
MGMALPEQMGRYCSFLFHLPNEFPFPFCHLWKRTVPLRISNLGSSAVDWWRRIEWFYHVRTVRYLYLIASTLFITMTNNLDTLLARTLFFRI